MVSLTPCNRNAYLRQSVVAIFESIPLIYFSWWLTIKHTRLAGKIIVVKSVDRRVSHVCTGCFYWLRQLRRIRQSLDSDSLATLIYAVVNSRMDYCNTVLAGASRTVTDKLQRVLNVAVRVITGTRNFDRDLGQILHWLNVPDQVLFKVAVTVHQCLNGRAPPYLSEHCIPVSSADAVASVFRYPSPRFWPLTSVGRS